LVVPGVQFFTGGEQAIETQHLRRVNPEATALRQRSRTAYAHAAPMLAARVAQASFPRLVDQPSGGMPPLPAGAKLIGFATTHAAQLVLPGGKHAILESLGQIAKQTGPDKYEPINLSLQSAHGIYAPVSPDIVVQMPSQLASGVVAPEAGVSLTPVDSQGHPLDGSEGTLDGASVLYANTQTDTDTLAKPTVAGFELDSVLRSADSPQLLYFKVGLPTGAQLVQDPHTGVVSVREGTGTLATIPAPSAYDAAQAPVPVSTHVSGDVLTVEVTHRSGSFQYPVELDPEVRTLEDRRVGELYSGVSAPTGWKFLSTPTGAFTVKGGWGGETLTDENVGSYEAGQSAAFVYETQKESKIYEVLVESSGSDLGADVEAYVAVLPRPSAPKWVKVSENYAASWGGSCNDSIPNYPECEGAKVETQKNSAVFEQAAYGKGAGFTNVLLKAHVLIAQEASPTIAFNTSKPTLANGQTNVFYGGGKWIGPSSGAYEVEGADPGIGISHFEINTSTRSWSIAHNYLTEKLCSGVQCYPTLKESSLNQEGEIFSYNNKLPDGEDVLEAAIENPMSMWSPLLKGTLKVDSTAPYGIKVISGLAESGAEISAAPHQIEIEAKDGTKPTPSSGVKSIAVAIDGREIGTPAGSCTPGECTAKGTWTIQGESLGAGEHKLTITATDNAGNVSATKVITFAIRNATPVTLGPGAVDPTTGQYSLTATDVAISGAGSLSRTYLSRSPESASGPFGPQWNLSIGTGEMLKLLPNGGAELTGSSAGLTIFASNGSGGFVPPKGDGNLTLEPKEKEAGKGITEYLLKDPAAGTSITFTQPTGSSYVTPTYASKAGAYGHGAGQLSGALGVAVDGKNNVWVSDTSNGRIEEFNEKGAFVATMGYGVTNGESIYQTCTSSCQTGLRGGGAGELDQASGIAIDSKGNIWIADTQNNRVQELNEKGEFVAALGFGVSTGENKFQVCTSGCRAGIYGSGNGQFLGPNGITADSKGNIWVADSGNNRVEEFNEKREYVTKIGSEGSGAGQFLHPLGIAADTKGNIWVSDTYNNRIVELNSKAEFVATFGFGVSNSEEKLQTCTASCHSGIGGTGKGQFKEPFGLTTDVNGDVWVSGRTHVQEFNEKKEYLGQFGASGTGEGQFTGANSTVMDGHGNMWVLDESRIEQWTHPLWWSTRTEGADGTDINTQSYRSLMAEERAITEPVEELGPVATGVSCSPKLEKGCRALTFTYATKTTASGENRTQWGEYLGRLAKVSFTGYNPESKEMTTMAVAEYSYDSHGRLRSAWDPRISPSLKTSYGYDTEGHVTALTPPGQESWVFTYGTVEADSSTGRLLKITRAPAAKLWGGELPKNTEAPKLSGSTIVGTKMGVSNGAWSNEPAAYSYQWEHCVPLSGECTSILGATNANYTVASSDAGFTLIAVVSAINGGGSIGQLTAASSVVLNTGTKVEGTHYNPGPGSTIEYRVPVSGTGAPYAMTSAELAKWAQSQLPTEATAIFPPDEAMGWPASGYKRAMVYYRDAHGRTTNVAAPSGGISTVEYNATNEVTRKLSPTNRAVALKEGSKSAEVAKALSTENTYNTEGTQLTGTMGPEHKVRLSNGAEVEARHHEELAYNEHAPGGEEVHNLVTKAATWSEAVVSKEVLDKQETINSYSGQENLGWKLRKPTAVTTEAGGHPVTQTTTYESATGDPRETTGPQSEYAPFAYASIFGGSGNKEGQFTHPMDDAIDASGNVWVADGYDNRVEEFSSSGAFIASYGKEGTNEVHETEVQFKEPVGLAINKTTGNIYVADQNNNRVVEFAAATGKIIRVFGKVGTGHGEFKEPNGVAIDSKGNVWVTDYTNNRVEKFNEEGKYLAEFGSGGKEEGKFGGPADIAISGEDLYVTDLENSRVEEFNEEGKKFLRVIGSVGSGNGQLKAPSGISIGTNGDVLVDDSGNSRVEAFTESGTFLFTFGTAGSGNGQMASPEGIALSASGAAYVTEAGTNNRVQEWAPRGGAEVSKTFYYSAKAESGLAACQNHPEWANLPCETQPAKQPETSGMPQLPATTTTYNMWESPETITEKISSKTGTVERTKKHGYDGAGREISSEVASSVNKALPVVKNEYNPETGMLEKQSIVVEGKTKTTTSVYNALGELTSYTDADGNTAKYTYDIDDRVEEVSDAKGSQMYAYDPTTGYLTKLLDSGAGTFTASYDVSGNMLTKGYPDGMTASYSYNSLEQATGLEYVKTTSCSEKCLLYKDTDAYSINEELTSQISTLSSESYAYDGEGRLIKTQETPVGKGCITRLYGYDEESNRTSLTTQEPNSKGECASEGGVTEQHCYDAIGRLCDRGVAYDEFGDMTKVPASDAGGFELTSSYYVDGQVSTQEQKGTTVAYGYDAAGRARETVTGTKTVTSHYDGSGDALAWTSEGEKWTRDIPGLDGTLDAIEGSGETAVLEIHNLKGDIVGTTGAKLEAEIKLFSPYEATEFGVPKGSAPTYSWLGADGVSTQFPSSGVVTTGGASYVPQIARELQTTPVEPPGARPNGSDSGMPYVTSLSPEAAQEVGALGAEAPAKQAEREQTQMEEACTEDPEACPIGDPQQMLSPAKLWQVIDELKNKATNGTLASEIVTAIPWINDIAAALGETYSDYVEKMAEHVEYCARFVEGMHPSGRCYVVLKVETKHVPIFGNLEFPYYVKAEPCFYTGYNHRTHSNSYYCGRYGEHEEYRP
jgi:YD repeat-containing protein